jgi:hypothetical protein
MVQGYFLGHPSSADAMTLMLGPLHLALPDIK